MTEEIQGKDEAEVEAQASEKPLEDLSLKELREMAEGIPGVSGVSTMKKEDLVEIIRKSREAGEEGLIERPVFKKPLDKMTVKELRDIAKDIPDVTGVTAMKKEQLLSLIREYWEIEEEEAAARRKKKKIKPTASPRELKLKIATLRTEKEKARAAKDKRMVGIYRRRINRLKKMSRKAAQV